MGVNRVQGGASGCVLSKKGRMYGMQGASPLSAALVVGPAFELLPPAGGGECSFFQ
jgi:hypothetical protein